MPHGILFSFPSKYFCAIGLRTCLGLGGLFSRVGPSIPRRPTRCSAVCVSSSTGPSPSSAASSKGIRLDTWRQRAYPHSRFVSGRVQVGLCRFHSPLLPVSRLLSFPAGTLMLRFPAFACGALIPIGGPVSSGPKPFGDSEPFRSGFPACGGYTAARSRIRRSPDRRVLASSRGISQLAASFFAAGAE